MRFKYILSFFIVFFVFIVCSSFSVDAATVNLIKGKEGFRKVDPFTDQHKKPFVYMTDDNINTSNALFSNEPVFFDLGDDFTINSFSVNPLNFDGASFYVKYYDFKFNEIKRYAKSSVSEVVNDIRYVSIQYKYLNPLNLREFEVFGYSNKVTDVLNLDIKPSVTSIALSWVNPESTNFNGVNVYKDGRLLTKVDKSLNSFVVNGLEANKQYNLILKSVDLDGKETAGISKSISTLVDPKTIPPGPVTAFVAEPSDLSVKLKWVNPKDDDLAGFKIMQDGKKIAEIGVQQEFEVKGLSSLTDYQFAIVAVDKDNNDSSSVSLSVKTLEEKDITPPHVPSNVFAKASDEALIATWDKVSDKDIAGYNVYLNGKKVNSNLITSSTFSIKNLKNDQKYAVQVSAVDKTGNESEKSSEAFGYPNKNTIPIIESKYNLADLSDGVGVMFGQLWIFLAWYLGIPLSFYIIYKLKQVYLP